MKWILVFLLIPSVACAGFVVDGVTNPATVDGVSEPAGVGGVTSDYSTTYTEQQDWPSTKTTPTAQPLGSAEDRRVVAGRFTASSAYTATQFGVYIHSITGSPTFTVTMKLYSKTSDSGFEDTPNSLLATSTATFDSSTVVVDTYAVAPFEGYSLSNGEDYWLTLTCSGHDASNYISVRYDSDGTGSRLMRSDDDPISWVNIDTSAELYVKGYSSP